MSKRKARKGQRRTQSGISGTSIGARQKLPRVRGGRGEPAPEPTIPHTVVYEPPEPPPPAPEPIKEGVVLADVAVGGQRLSLMADMRLFRRTEGAVKSIVPIDAEGARKFVYGVAGAKHECAATLEGWDRSRVPPLDVLARWRDRLVEEVLGEIMIVVCRSARGVEPVQWLAVVPEQEASGASCESDDLDDAYRAAAERGFEPAASTLHVHPGSMTGASGTDREDWSKASGIYLIAPRACRKVSAWASAGGAVWNLEHVVELPVLDAGGDLCMIGADGRTEDFAGLVKPPKVTTIVRYQGSLWDDHGQPLNPQAAYWARQGQAGSAAASRVYQVRGGRTEPRFARAAGYQDEEDDGRVWDGGFHEPGMVPRQPDVAVGPALTMGSAWWRERGFQGEVGRTTIMFAKDLLLRRVLRTNGTLTYAAYTSRGAGGWEDITFASLCSGDIAALRGLLDREARRTVERDQSSRAEVVRRLAVPAAARGAAGAVGTVGPDGSVSAPESLEQLLVHGVGAEACVVMRVWEAVGSPQADYTDMVVEQFSAEALEARHPDRCVVLGEVEYDDDRTLGEPPTE